MAEEGGVVRKLLTMLGFSVDEKSLGETEKTIEKLKESAEHLIELYASWEAAKKLYEMVNQTAELGEQTLRTSIKLGIGSEALQELQFAANQAGTSAGGLEAGLRFLARSAGAAAHGSGAMAANFANLGVTVTDATGQLKPMEVLMGEVSDGLAKMTNKTERSAMAIKIFGRGGLEMLPFLSQGSKKIKEQREEAEALGGVMSEKLLETSEKYIQVQKKLAFAWRGIQNIVATSLIPVFEKATNSFKNWMLENRKAFEVGIPKAVDIIYKMVYAVGDLIGVIGRGWSLIGQLILSFGSVGKYALEVAAGVGILGLAFMSPTFAIGLFIAAIAILMNDLEVYQKHGNGKSLLGEFVNWVTQANNAFMQVESDNPFVRTLQKIDGLVTRITSHYQPGSFLWDFINDWSGDVHRKQLDEEAWGKNHSTPFPGGSYSMFANGGVKPSWDFESGRQNQQQNIMMNMHHEINVNGAVAGGGDALADLIAKRVGEVNSVANIHAAAVLSSAGK